MIMGKIWGTTEDLLVTPLIEVHRLVIKPNAWCSLHKHEFKFNAFYVIEGELFIEVEKLAYALKDITRLGAGQLTTVKPNEDHLFRTKEEATLALEIYYLPTLGEDIIRKTVGSVAA